MNTEIEQEKRGRGRPRKRRILSITERENLSTMVASDAKDKKETAFEYPSLDSVTDTQTPRVKKELANGEVDSLSKSEKIRMESRYKELTEYLVKTMVTKAQTMLRPSKDGVQSYDFRKTAEQMAKVEMNPERNKFAQEWKNLGRELWPDEPERSNLESIRPE